MKKSLLIIARDSQLLSLFDQAAPFNGFELHSTREIEQGLRLLGEALTWDAVLLEVDSLHEELPKLIGEIKTLSETTLIVLLGALSAEELVECVKAGADGFIEKPVHKAEQVLRHIEHLLNQLPGRPVARDADPAMIEAPLLVGQSENIQQLKSLVHKVAPLDATVLILGETGTGKEVIARMIHAMGPNRHNNFLAVHCGGIPDTLLESTLFGHEKGSFTGAYRTHKGYFEIADRGTIFLDEIGDTTPSFQVKLLRVLQDKRFRRIGGTELLSSSARIIAATNRDLHKMVQEGQFREDLYFRLNVITLRMPPLRERPDDIALLIRHFVSLYSKKHNHLGVYLKPETIEILSRQPWRGNVRELENIIERLVALSDSDWIGPSELPEDYLGRSAETAAAGMGFHSYAEAKNLFEKEYITQLLLQARGNISQAAKMAQMPRQNLHLKIKKHKIRPETIRNSRVLSIPVEEKI
ncbi:MAG TPA: sigma-54 dependent transcriptional regulator [bacterium]|nr:sigma-54 dependent transcriptional regulator [bacterium]HPR88830.1 sigma-54 dependent transcriptional regulator [bacterium]